MSEKHNQDSVIRLPKLMKREVIRKSELDKAIPDMVSPIWKSGDSILCNPLLSPSLLTEQFITPSFLTEQFIPSWKIGFKVHIQTWWEINIASIHYTYSWKQRKRLRVHIPGHKLGHLFHMAPQCYIDYGIHEAHDRGLDWLLQAR